jgi:hypothetical protein
MSKDDMKEPFTMEDFMHVGGSSRQGVKEGGLLGMA